MEKEIRIQYDEKFPYKNYIEIGSEETWVKIGIIKGGLKSGVIKDITPDMSLSEIKEKIQTFCEKNRESLNFQIIYSNKFILE